MSLFSLVWKYLRDRPLNTALNIFLLALGIAVMTVLLLFSNLIEEKVTSNAKGIDLVAGAKGSPLQLILCSIFHVDFPTGNIKVSDAEKVARHRMVKKAIPLALGDSYSGYRIVGTNRSYPDLYSVELAQGSWWSDDLEVTVGATVAETTKLKIGDTFASAHGLTTDGSGHEEHRYVVSGTIRKSNTVVDNLILTNVESLWKVHDLVGDSTAAPLHPSRVVPGIDETDTLSEVTSLLIQYRNPLAAIQLPRFINSIGNLQAASPAYETARLFSILGVGAEVLRGFAFVLVFISGLSIFIALYNSLKERKYDMAIMRSMGASKMKLSVCLMLEGTFLTSMGCLLGVGLGHAVLAVFANVVEEGARAGLTPAVFYLAEVYILAGSLLLGVVCSLVPAVQAYRTDIHKVLAGT